MMVRSERPRGDVEHEEIIPKVLASPRQPAAPRFAFPTSLVFEAHPDLNNRTIVVGLISDQNNGNELVLTSYGL